MFFPESTTENILIFLINRRLSECNESAWIVSFYLQLNLPERTKRRTWTEPAAKRLVTTETDYWNIYTNKNYSWKINSRQSNFCGTFLSITLSLLAFNFHLVTTNEQMRPTLVMSLHSRQQNFYSTPWFIVFYFDASQQTFKQEKNVIKAQTRAHQQKKPQHMKLLFIDEFWLKFFSFCSFRSLNGTTLQRPPKPQHK